MQFRFKTKEEQNNHPWWNSKGDMDYLRGNLLPKESNKEAKECYEGKIDSFYIENITNFMHSRCRYWKICKDMIIPIKLNPYKYFISKYF